MILNSGVYEIVNTVNGNRYIGSSVNIYRRWHLHKHDLRYGKHHSSYLQRAWNKYGEDKFIFRMILICDSRNVIYYENLLLGRFHPVYNLCLKAKSCFGIKRSDEQKRKLSELHKGIALSEEHKQKLRDAAKHRPPISEETRERKRIAAKNRPPISEETRERLRLAKLGKKLSREHIEKIAIMRKRDANGHYLCNELV
jgi:group I intron endonuclease